MTMNIYYKQSDITASLSELMLSPWALECDSTRAMGIQEALHLIQDMINGEVPETMKIPAADVVEVIRCKDCEYSYDSIGGWVCSHGPCVDCIVPEDFFCKYGKCKEGER